MELLFNREHKSGMMGGLKLSLTATAQIDEEEKKLVKDFKMGELLIYEKENAGVNTNSVKSMFIYKFLVPRITVSELIAGKTIEAKDLIEILSAEEQIRKAGEYLHYLLVRAKRFSEETVHTFKDE